MPDIKNEKDPPNLRSSLPAQCCIHCKSGSFYGEPRLDKSPIPFKCIRFDQLVFPWQVCDSWRYFA